MRKKIFFFIGSLKKGGAERNTALLANQLQEDFDISIVVFEKQINFELHPDIKIFQIDRSRFKIKFLNILVVWWRLFWLVHKGRPKYLISMSRIGGLFVSSLLYFPTFVRFDIYPLLGYKEYKKWQMFIMYNLPWVKYVICPSEELKEDVSRYFIRKAKLRRVYNPIADITTIRNMSKFQAPDRKFYIVVGRLSNQKRIDLIIQAYVESKSYEFYDLYILGDGPKYPNLQSQVSNLKMNSHVKFLGFVNNPYNYIKNAELLISASTREGFPNVLLEALSLGTPVVSSKCKTGPSEIIFHGKNGFLFQVGAKQELIKILEKLIREPELLNMLKSNTSIGLNRFEPDLIKSEWRKLIV